MKQRNEFPDVKQMIYVENVDRKNSKEQITILQQQGKHICCCISFIDPYVHLAAMLSKEMGLFQSSTDALFIMEEKTRVRDALNELSVTPFYTIFNPDELIDSFVEQYEQSFTTYLKTPGLEWIEGHPPCANDKRFSAWTKTIEKKTPTNARFN